MEQKYKDIDKKIFSVEFRKFFNKELIKSLETIEKARKQYLLLISVEILFALISFVFLINAIILYCNSSKHNDYGMMVSVFIFIILITFITKQIKSYKTKAKNIVFEKLLSFIGNFKMNKMKIKDTEYLRSLKVFNGLNFPNINNYILGKYGLLDIEIIEIQNKKSEYNKSHIFQGVLIKIPSIKKFKNSTVIKIKDSKTNQNIGEKVNINDSDFEKYYDVYSDDKVEAKYLITTSFMSRMVQLIKHEPGGNISVSFEYGNVNIAVSSDKDWFEVPIMKPATDVTIYRPIVLEIISILKIIDSLKLEKKIGL